MNEPIDPDTPMAILRSDLPTLALRLWDTRIEMDLVPEYQDYAIQIGVNAHLQGEMAASSTSLNLDLEELVTLIEGLRELLALRTLTLYWQTYSRSVEIHLRVQMQKMGPPVVCDIWLRDSGSMQEEHHCCFETNLTWLSQFLADLERWAFGYRHAQNLVSPHHS